MPADLDSCQTVFLFCAGLFVAMQVWLGWRAGVICQLVKMLALVAAYTVAIFGGRFAVPILRPAGYPDLLVSIVAGAALGLVTFVSVAGLGAILFRRTKEQSLGLVRLGYGLGGAAIGLAFGLFAVWLVVLGIKVLGTAAETQVRLARTAAAASAPPATAAAPKRGQPERAADRVVAEPGAVAGQLVRLKDSLDAGATGVVMQGLDPLPAKVYDILTKTVHVISQPESAVRLLDFPGARGLSEHPRIVALGRDPAIARQIQARDFLGLLKNESIVAAANDPEIGAIIRDFELENALDYALRPGSRGH